MAELFVLGIAVVDFVMRVESLPRQATKYRADAAEVVGGGCATNAAVAIARLGGHAKLAARLGDDALGEVILADLQAMGVSTEHIQRTLGGRSSFSSILVDSRGERQIVNFRGSGLSDDIGWLDRIGPADAVLVDPRWQEAAHRALMMARDWNVPGVLDADPPFDTQLLHAASHVALSREGLHTLTDIEDTAAALEAVASDCPGWICVTDGAHGVFYADKAGIAHIPAFDVPVKDTTAAGDIWHGAFALALAEGRPEAEAIRFANATAALKCMEFGGRAGAPDRPTVDRFFKERT